MGTDAALVAEVIAAGERAGERGWELPLWDEYREHIKSDIADMRNTGGRPAGRSTAGRGGRGFGEWGRWVHIASAGTAYPEGGRGTRGGGPTGGTGGLLSGRVRVRRLRGPRPRRTR